MDKRQMILAIAQTCVDEIENWAAHEDIALTNMDRMRCPLDMADEELYNSILEKIEEYGDYNEVDVDDIDPEEVFWAVGDLESEKKKDEKKFFYVSIGYCGPLCKTEGNQKYGYGRHGRADKVVPIYCSERELDTVARAVGKGLLADSCTVSLTEDDAWDAYVAPYAVLWDCM